MCDIHVSNGPVSSMPGSSHALPEGSMCDKHHEAPAVRRIQGETDSFGCEYALMCQACLDEYQQHRQAKYEAKRYCEWCRSMKTGVRSHRDYEEGSSGRLYDVCAECRAQELDRLREELDDYY